MGDMANCGRRGHMSRRAAKAHAARHHPGEKLRAYYCRQGCGYWHLGELPRDVVAGDVTAAEFYDQPERWPRPEPGRSPKAQLRRWRLNAATAVEKDLPALADAWADRCVPDRGNDAWACARRDACAILGELPGLLRELAGPPDSPPHHKGT